jgi:hypothetical protein
MPFLHIGLSMLSAQGKLMALLWQVFLMAGPCYKDIRAFLGRVRSITTDFGTERLLATHPDLFHNFCREVGIAIPSDAQKLPRVFPRALQAPGWRHSWDGCIKRGLSSPCKWFPCFLERLKAIVSFLRESMDDMCEELIADGRSGIGSMFRTVGMEAFAKWRWGTCDAVVANVRKIWGTFTSVFRGLRFVKKMKFTASKLPKIAAACVDADFSRQLEFVGWFCSILTRLLKWGGSCPCHQEDFLAGRQVECGQKGRLLKIASPYIKERLGRMLKDANEWTPASFNLCSFELLASFQAAVRLACATAYIKFEYLDHPPYLFARLDEPGIKESILKLWNAKPAEHHDDATIEIMQNDEVLRSAFDSMRPPVIPPPLDAVCKSIEFIPLDDNVAEGPHALAKRWGETTRAALFPWIASSCRLDQNMTDIRRPDFGGTPEHLNLTWKNHGCIAQVRSDRNQRRPKRMPRKKLITSVYRLAHMSDLKEDPKDSFKFHASGLTYNKVVVWTPCWRP